MVAFWSRCCKHIMRVALCLKKLFGERGSHCMDHPKFFCFLYLSKNGVAQESPVKILRHQLSHKVKIVLKNKYIWTILYAIRQGLLSDYFLNKSNWKFKQLVKPLSFQGFFLLWPSWQSQMRILIFQHARVFG